MKPIVHVTGLDTPLGNALVHALGDACAVVAWDAAAAGDVDVIVHLAGATATDARLDVALQQDLVHTRDVVEFAHAHHARVVLASRLSVVGQRRGLHTETDPREALFGTSGKKGRDLELHDEEAACRALIAQAQDAASHADRASHVDELAKKRLHKLSGATGGQARVAMRATVHDELLGAALTQALTDRARGWGFMHGSVDGVRGYTSALAELCVSASDVPALIVRLPALTTSPGTSGHAGDALSDLYARVQDGMLRVPVAPTSRIEMLPVHVVAQALAVAVRAALVHTGGVQLLHVATTERAPLRATRAIELLDLHLRRTRHDDVNTLDAHAQLTRALSVDVSPQWSPPMAEGAALVRTGLRALGAFLPTASLPKPLRTLADDTARVAESLAAPDADDVARFTSAPFFDDEQRFTQRGLRMCATRAALPMPVLDVDWRAHLLDAHWPALQSAHAHAQHAHKTLPRPAFDSLVHLLEETSVRYGSRPALSQFLGTDVVDVSYRELHERARAAALRLQKAGVVAGDRVILSGLNHPSWGIVAFGAFLLRAQLVPLDPNLPQDATANIVQRARPRLAVVDKHARNTLGDALPELVLDLQLTATTGPGLAADSEKPTRDDAASVLFTSGTTGEPKGVVLTHGNFTSLLASLASIFPVGRGDRLLSVLPLHHTFEFSGGFLMPLAAGAQVFTPEAITGEAVLYALKAGRITALVGVPAVWQLLERRIAKQVAERGELVGTLFDVLMKANAQLGKKTGLTLGRYLLKPVHDQLGGHLRTLISGGAALPPAVHEMFQGLGLPLAEGYGLTEAAPVLTVAEGVPGAPSGTVGRPIPGVEIKIVDVDGNTVAHGVGEVLARGPNVMRGYFENDDATRTALDADGWLHTGDLGTFDDDGRLRLVGRAKDVVVTASGENIYLDDTEKRLENVEHITQLTLVGLPDARGGERLALAAVPAINDVTGREKALEALRVRVQKLPAFARPSLIELVDGPLPLTATRKVKRKDVRVMLEALLLERERAQQAVAPEGPTLSAARSAIALVAGVDVKKLTGATRLPQDLGFDSLMWVELATALEPLAGKLDPEVLVTKETVSAVESYLREASSSAAKRPLQNARDDVKVAKAKDDALRLPGFLKAPARAAITMLQREAYRTLFSSTVVGRSRIPYNRNTIVVANHTSHLDTGLVKFALGRYGKDLRPLAAKDYFFEGNRAKVAFFTELTNLVPIDRETGSGLAFEQALDVIEAGHVVLIFPEGTRREDGALGAFKPLVARLSLMTGVDVLPLHMQGNFDALPRGSVVPNLNARDLKATIGLPLAAREMARLTAHLPNVQAARAATEIIRAAIVALSEGRVLDLERVVSLDRVESGVRVLHDDSEAQATA